MALDSPSLPADSTGIPKETTVIEGGPGRELRAQVAHPHVI